ncbi:hypothetical protein KL907_005415 [Ogataea polymorpha]|nr:hypothetical protein KL907_005415 [Ogataea polymorpha]
MHTEIDFSAVPGTSHLVDLDHSEQAVAETKEGIVLIPTPSDDPNDPLNWSRNRKWLNMFCIIVYVFGGCIPACCIYSILTDISAEPEINITTSQLNAGTGYWFLFLGIGGLFMMPLAQHRTSPPTGNGLHPRSWLDFSMLPLSLSQKSPLEIFSLSTKEPRIWECTVLHFLVPTTWLQCLLAS